MWRGVSHLLGVYVVHARTNTHTHTHTQAQTHTSHIAVAAGSHQRGPVFAPGWVLGCCLPLWCPLMCVLMCWRPNTMIVSHQGIPREVRSKSIMFFLTCCECTSVLGAGGCGMECGLPCTMGILMCEYTLQHSCYSSTRPLTHDTPHTNHIKTTYHVTLVVEGHQEDVQGCVVLLCCVMNSLLRCVCWSCPGGQT